MSSDYVKAQYYSVEDGDYITADSVHQAVLDWFEGFDGSDSDGRFPIAPEVEVQGYNREVISEDTKCPLYWMEYIVENLDENYGCEYWGEYTPSEEAMTHWKEFVKCVIKEYPVSRLKEVGKPFKVNVEEVLCE